MEASVCCAGVLLGGAGACIELAAAGVELKLLWVSGTSLAGGGALLNSRMLLGGDLLSPPSTNN